MPGGLVPVGRWQGDRERLAAPTRTRNLKPGRYQGEPAAPHMLMTTLTSLLLRLPQPLLT